MKLYTRLGNVSAKFNRFQPPSPNFVFVIAVNAIIFVTWPTRTTVLAGDSNDNRKTLNIIGLFPFSGSFNGGESMEASTRIGEEQINAMNVIPGYKLAVAIHDTQCDPGVGLVKLFSNIYGRGAKTSILVFGAGCSAVTMATATASQHLNIVQISPVSFSPKLSEKKEYPLFARLAVPDTSVNPARVFFIRHFGWKRLGFITHTASVFESTVENLTKTFNKEGDIYADVFSDDPDLQLQILKKYDIRIILTLGYMNAGRKVLCRAYHLGMYGPKYVWIYPGWYDDGWWREDDNTINCTKEQLNKAAEGIFQLGAGYTDHLEEKSHTGWTPADFKDRYTERVQHRSLPSDFLAAQVYDAIWAVALALNKTYHQLLGTGKNLEDFNYKDQTMAKMIYQNFLSLSFRGLRGDTYFDENGDANDATSVLSRVQGGKLVEIGCIDRHEGEELDMHWSKDNPLIWEGGMVPTDATPTRTSYVHISPGIQLIVNAMGAVGIVVALFFLGFNYRYREVRMIKMSSPRINNVILTGCILYHGALFVNGLGEAYGTILGCELPSTLTSFGSCIAFGALYAKTWRVHVIFTNTKLNRKCPKDSQLFVMLGALVLVELTLYIIWWSIDRRYFADVDIEWTTVEDPIQGEVRVRWLMRVCYSKHQKYFSGSLFAITGIILLLGAFLAFEVRNVHYPELNDSQYIAMSIYTIMMLFIPAVILNFSAKKKNTVDITFGILQTILFLATFSAQCLIFVPKITTYYQNRKKNIPETITAVNPPVSHEAVSQKLVPRDMPDKKPIQASCDLEDADTASLFDVKEVANTAEMDTLLPHENKTQLPAEPAANPAEPSATPETTTPEATILVKEEAKEDLPAEPSAPAEPAVDIVDIAHTENHGHTVDIAHAENSGHAVDIAHAENHGHDVDIAHAEYHGHGGNGDAISTVM